MAEKSRHSKIKAELGVRVWLNVLLNKNVKTIGPAREILGIEERRYYNL